MNRNWKGAHLLETRARGVRVLQLLQVVVRRDLQAHDLLLGRLQTRLKSVLLHTAHGSTIE